jgi:hypothetical protein
MTSKALEWARKQGLNCEQDIMAATLRQLCHITIVLQIIAANALVIAAIMVFG